MNTAGRSDQDGPGLQQKRSLAFPVGGRQRSPRAVVSIELQRSKGQLLKSNFISSWAQIY